MYQRFAIISSNLERAFFNMGYSTLFCNTGNSLEKMQQYLGMLASKRVEALILLGSQLSRPDIVELLRKYFKDIPIVTADLVVDMPNCYCVTVDHVYAIEVAVNYLLSRGHEHLAFVACTNSINTQKKADAFKSALKARNLPIHANNSIVHIPMDICEEPSPDFAELIQSVSTEFSGIIFFPRHGCRQSNWKFPVSWLFSSQGLCCNWI